MKITLKNVKMHPDMSEETNCFSASIYLDGKRIGFVKNEGRGGVNLVDREDRKAGAKVEAYAKTLPPLPPFYKGGKPLEYNLDMLIGDLLEKYEEERIHKRWYKKGTVFRLKGDKKGEWKVIHHPYSEAVKTHLIEKYGDELEEILHDRFATV